MGVNKMIKGNTPIPARVQEHLNNNTHKNVIKVHKPNHDEYDDIDFKAEKEEWKKQLLEDVEKQEQRRLHPINFDGIIGHDDLKEEILLAVLGKLNNDERSKAYLASIDDHATTGILLYGLPGVGKSNIMRSIEKSLINHPDIDCISLDCSEFQGNVGTNAKIINERFEEARNTKKLCCILLIDEIDSVLMKKRGHINVAERTNAMQSNMDGMKDSSKIIIIGATNHIDGMEDASISRFTVINLGLPTSTEREDFIRRYILPIPMESVLNTETIVKYTDGFTGRNFRDIGMKLNRIVSTTKKPIDNKVLLKEISKFMSASQRNKNRLDDMNKDNSLNCILSSIIRKEDNVTLNREHNALYTVDTLQNISIESFFKDNYSHVNKPGSEQEKIKLMAEVIHRLRNELNLSQELSLKLWKDYSHVRGW